MTVHPVFTPSIALGQTVDQRKLRVLCYNFAVNGYSFVLSLLSGYTRQRADRRTKYFMTQTHRIVRCTERHFERMLTYVSRLNPSGEHHIGYFGVTPEDIRQSVLMLNLRYDRGFRLLLEGGELQGVMGVDFDREIRRAWLYGPIVTANEWPAAADLLYDAVRKAIPAGISEHEMFVDARNSHCRQFAARHKFHPYGEMAIFYIAPDRLAVLPAAEAEPWDARFADQFVALHDTLFPRSNYTLSYMLHEVEKGAIFLTLSDGDNLAGYFFGRSEVDSGEAYVDLVGIAAPYRRNGLGRRLMLAGLSRLREMPGLRQVNLTVDAGNDAARQLYYSLGFQLEREMVAFRKATD